MILVGPQAKPFRSIEATVKLADHTKYATAVIPNAKVTNFFPTKLQTGLSTVAAHMIFLLHWTHDVAII